MKWITITPTSPSPSGKTRRWIVASKEGGRAIGNISWYPAWRKYVFCPGAGTVFEQDCLREIADFLAAATREHGEDLKARRAAGVPHGG